MKRSRPLAYDARLQTTESADAGAGTLTISEIRQQPDTWLDTARRVRQDFPGDLSPAVLTGAGTSFFAAVAIEAAWPGSRAVPSTELFLDFEAPLAHRNLVVSLARSGDSPESVAVVEKIQKKRPAVRHIALTLNPDGRLANWPGVEPILLDPRANDQSLAMTSSFTNLVLAGMCLARLAEVEAALPRMCSGAATVLREYEVKAQALAETPPARVVALAPTPLFGAAREVCLKILEMSAGRIATLAETWLGVRHGPMSFIEPETLVICFVSSDRRRRRYEMDLAAELRAKKLGRLVALASPDAETELFHETISTDASALPDYLRTPADIVFCQLLSFYLSRRLGLDPDNPSPGGVIHRVVQGVRIYED